MKNPSLDACMKMGKCIRIHGDYIEGKTLSVKLGFKTNVLQHDYWNFSETTCIHKHTNAHTHIYICIHSNHNLQ